MKVIKIKSLSEFKTVLMELENKNPLATSVTVENDKDDEWEKEFDQLNQFDEEEE